MSLRFEIQGRHRAVFVGVWIRKYGQLPGNSQIEKMLQQADKVDKHTLSQEDLGELNKYRPRAEYYIIRQHQILIAVNISGENPRVLGVRTLVR